MKNLENMSNEEKKQFILDNMTTKITTNPNDSFTEDMYVEFTAGIKTTMDKYLNDEEHKFIEAYTKNRLYNHLNIAFTNTDKIKRLLNYLKRLRLEERIDKESYYTLKNMILNMIINLDLESC